MKKLIPTTILIAVVAIAISSCTAHVHSDINPNDVIIHGFWYGLWNGFISPITFIISLFSDSITVWETHNNGNWYTFGFLLGCGALYSSTTKSNSK